MQDVGGRRPALLEAGGNGSDPGMRRAALLFLLCELCVCACCVEPAADLVVLLRGNAVKMML